MQFSDISGPDEFSRLFDVSRETLDGLKLYGSLLRKWQKAVNLVAPSTIDQIWHRHIGDSAQIVDILNKSDSSQKSGLWLDIGSGGGFPGLVAAIMLSDKFDYRFHLVESNGRKCAFLSDVVRHLSLPVEIHNDRVESLANNSAFSKTSIISARALASLDTLMTFCEPFADPYTTAYFFKGREVQKELDLAGEKWIFGSKQYQSKTSSDGRILEITGFRPR
jgi:16S rRNA (guanine527-N7)-methyltransferase